MRRQDAHERERNRRHDGQWHVKGLEPPHDEDVDENEHGGEREAEVAEDLIRDVPFAVPLHGALRRVERLTRVVDLERVPPAASRSR